MGAHEGNLAVMLGGADDAVLAGGRQVLHGTLPLLGPVRIRDGVEQHDVDVVGPEPPQAAVDQVQLFAAAGTVFQRSCGEKGKHGARAEDGVQQQLPPAL